jgi:arsenate reductase (thioredoxin)
VKRKVLFLSSSGVHGAMAEALLNRIGAGNFEAVSAGTEPGKLDSFTLEIMKETNIDLSHITLRSIEEFIEKEFDYVIRLGNCPQFNELKFRCAEVIQWTFENPDMKSMDPERLLRTLRSIRDQITQRLHLLVLVLVPRHAALATATK